MASSSSEEPSGSVLSPTSPEVVLAELIRRWRPPAVRLSLWLALAIVSLIAIGELDRLISGALSSGSRGSALASVMGPLSLSATDSWAAWVSSAIPENVAGWIFAGTILDGLFILAYVGLLAPVIRRRSELPRVQPGRRIPLRRTWSGRFLLTLLLLELLEAVATALAALALAARWAGFLDWFGWVVAALATAKWLATALLAVALLRNAGTRRFLFNAFRYTVRALWLHRLAVVYVVLLGVLACVPSDGVLDQLPDIQRQWIGGELGPLHIAAASVATVLAAAAAFALGRSRTRRRVDQDARGLPPEQASMKAVIGWWLIPAIAWAALAAWALAVALLNDIPLGTLFGVNAWIFLVVLAVVLGVSALLRKKVPWRVTAPSPLNPSRAAAAWIVGDLLAVAVFGVAGAGLVRSMTAPVALGWGDPYDLASWWWALALLVLGMLLAVVVGPSTLRYTLRTGSRRRGPLGALVKRNNPLERRNPSTPDLWRPHRRWLGGIISAGLVVLFAMAVFPTAIAWAIGPVAVMVLALTAWTGVLGAFTVALQEYQPLAVFRLFRLRGTPVLTLALTIPLVVSAVTSTLGSDPEVHAVRSSAADDAGTRDSTPGTPASRRVQDLDCTVTVGGATVKPVLVVAAEGGGIRAAYWTARTLDRLREETGCLAESILLSSGVSGGSVGLTLTAIGSGASAQTELEELASPETVGSGVAALAVGDAIATATGVLVPSLPAGPGAEWWRSLTWHDRAALIELAWSNDIEDLADRYTAEASDRAGVLLLNSTDVDSGCRVVVGPDPFARQQPETRNDCGSPTIRPAATRWLSDTCLHSLDWASAAMLSSRFPIITPAGRMTEANDCPKGAQLIDGGYAEGSALGTVADLAPRVAQLLRDENAQPDDGAYLLPVLVFLRNSAGFDLVEQFGEVTAEPLVPLFGYAAATEQVDHEAWIQRITTSFEGVCPDGAGACRSAQHALRSSLPNGVVVVAPATRPTVLPPLGWALSGYSIASLEDALDREASCAGGARPSLETARLCELIALDPAAG